MERRYVIDYLYEGQRLGPVEYDEAIPESELRQRISSAWIACIKGITASGGDWGAAIQVLLHGEGKEQSNRGIPIRDGDGNLCFPEEDKPWPGPDDILEMRGKKPSAPTRKEIHDQWQNRKPVFWNEKDMAEWVEATKQWLREEPER